MIPGSRAAAAILLAGLISAPVRSPSSVSRAVAKTHERNREALEQFSWTSRTEVRSGGELQAVLLVRSCYDRSGKLHRATIRDAQDTDARGPIRKHRANRRRKKADELHRKLRELIRTYTDFSSEARYAVFSRASVVPVQDEEDLVRVQVRNLVRQGDSMHVWADALTHRLRRLEIVTSLDGEPVNVVSEYRDLEDGPTHPARTTIRTETRGRPVVLVTENFDYRRGNG